MINVQNRISRLRKSLEPLAVLYEKAVVQSLKEPAEVRLKIQQSADHLGEHYSGDETVHIIDGEALRAAHEVCEQYRRIELDISGTTDPLGANEVGDARLLDDPNALSAPEREWLQWYYDLSDEDRSLVEIYGELDIAVSEENIDRLREVSRHRAESSPSTVSTVVPLFK